MGNKSRYSVSYTPIYFTAPLIYPLQFTYIYEFKNIQFGYIRAHIESAKGRSKYKEKNYKALPKDVIVPQLKGNKGYQKLVLKAPLEVTHIFEKRNYQFPIKWILGFDIHSRWLLLFPRESEDLSKNDILVIKKNEKVVQDFTEEPYSNRLPLNQKLTIKAYPVENSENNLSFDIIRVWPEFIQTIALSGYNIAFQLPDIFLRSIPDFSLVNFHSKRPIFRCYYDYLGNIFYCREPYKNVYFDPIRKRLRAFVQKH